MIWSRRAQRTMPATTLINKSLNRPKPRRIGAGEREDAAEAAERIEAADVGADALGHEQEADLEDVGQDAGEHDEAEERQHDAGEALR